VVTDRRASARGQAHTLEAFVSAMVLLASVVFALQVTAVTPLSASTSNQHIENQQEGTAEGLLSAAAETGALRRAVLFWGDTGADGRSGFRDADNGLYYTRLPDPPSNEFLSMIREAFGGRGIAVNVYVRHQTAAGDERVTRLLYQGEPSDNAATAFALVTLYEDDVLYADVDGDGAAEPTGTTISGANFYAPDTDGSGTGIYTVVRVEVVAWRM
jgi:hypothetical protein